MDKTLGILGGGQLGRMIAEAALEMKIKTVIYCDSKDSCATQKANKNIVADYADLDSLRTFADQCDVITFEFENIPVATVEFLEKIANIHPSSKILKITQNRLTEKRFINNIDIATTDFIEIKSRQDLVDGFKKFGKSILKTATLGYDGKGQFVIKKESDIDSIMDIVEKSNLENNGLILEKFCPFESEASVIISRSIAGEISCYDPLTNIHKNGILDKSIYPAQISQESKIRAKNIATKIAQEIALGGLLAIEFFILENGDLVVNEIAPRPHNSGHFSMDGSNTSQFKQLILAILGKKLGNTEFFTNGYMQNLIGKDINNISQYQANNNARIHIYGKKEVRNGRKMGHINLINQN